MAEERHSSGEDYSSWLIPAAERTLKAAGLSLRDVDIFAVASGPGSFTGLRVGLATVKGFAEVYGRQIAAVSRLEAIAYEATADSDWVAPSFDAQRGQIFGAVYRNEGSQRAQVGQARVLEPPEFVNYVAGIVPAGKAAWVSLDPETLRAEPLWKCREQSGESLQHCTGPLAPRIGRIGYSRALSGKLINADALEADYIRRSDAEIFWKGRARPADHGR